MKAVAKSNQGLDVHLVLLKYVKQRPTDKTHTFTLHELRSDMVSKVRMEYFWTWTVKISKIF